MRIAACARTRLQVASLVSSGAQARSITSWECPCSRPSSPAAPSNLSEGHSRKPELRRGVARALTPVLHLLLFEVAELAVGVARLEDPDQREVIVRGGRQALAVRRPAHAVHGPRVLRERGQALRRQSAAAVSPLASFLLKG